MKKNFFFLKLRKSKFLKFFQVATVAVDSKSSRQVCRSMFSRRRVLLARPGLVVVHQVEEEDDARVIRGAHESPNGLPEPVLRLPVVEIPHGLGSLQMVARVVFVRRAGQRERFEDHHEPDEAWKVESGGQRLAAADDPLLRTVGAELPRTCAVPQRRRARLRAAACEGGRTDCGFLPCSWR